MITIIRKALEYSQLDGTPTSCVVTIGDSENTFVGRLTPDKIDIPDSELIQEVFNYIYSKFFPNKAENEKFTAVDNELRQIQENEKNRELTFNAKMLEIDTQLKAVREAVQELALGGMNE